MTDRCEPPPELRGVDGWHWLGAHCPVFWIAEEQEWDWTEDEHVAPDAAYRYGYRYLSPVATPAEVEALTRAREQARAERDAYDDINATLRDRVAKLEAAGHRALNYIENCESEHGITLECGDALRATLSPKPTE